MVKWWKAWFLKTMNQVPYQFSSNESPLTQFNFSSSGLPILGNHFFSQHFSNWASKTPRAYGSYGLLYSHYESSRKWPQKIALNQKWLYLILALFIWGDGFCFGVVFYGGGSGGVIGPYEDTYCISILPYYPYCDCGMTWLLLVCFRFRVRNTWSLWVAWSTRISSLRLRVLQKPDWSHEK